MNLVLLEKRATAVGITWSQKLLGAKPLAHDPIGGSVGSLIVTSGHVLNGKSLACPRHFLYGTAAWSTKTNKHAVLERSLTTQGPDNETGVASYHDLLRVETPVR